jgi:hypothetical protein
MKLDEAFKLYGDDVKMINTRNDWSFEGLPAGGIYSIRWLKTVCQFSNEHNDRIMVNDHKWEVYDENAPYKFMSENKPLYFFCPLHKKMEETCNGKPDEVCYGEAGGIKYYFRKLWKRK